MTRNDRVRAKAPTIIIVPPIIQDASIQSRHATQTRFTKSQARSIRFPALLPSNTPFPFPRAIDRNLDLAVVLKFSI